MTENLILKVFNNNFHHFCNFMWLIREEIDILQKYWLQMTIFVEPFVGVMQLSLCKIFQNCGFQQTETETEQKKKEKWNILSVCGCRRGDRVSVTNKILSKTQVHDSAENDPRMALSTAVRRFLQCSFTDRNGRISTTKTFCCRVAKKNPFFAETWLQAA